MAFIVIDEELCAGCGTCVDGCPQGALDMVDAKAHVAEPSACIYCLSCMENCLAQAIRLAEESAAHS